MRVDDLPDRVVIILIGLLVILTPAVFLTITIGFLLVTDDLAAGRITLLELLELYIIDLAIMAVVAYGLYRLTHMMVVHRLPDSLEARDRKRSEDTGSEESERGDE